MWNAMSKAEPAPAAPAAARDNRTFERLAEPFRREIKVHCYRMLGSLHDADDLVQETYLRGWRAFDSLEDQGAVRAWLYRIATNACLSALESRKLARRWLPDQHAPAMAIAQMPEGGPPADVAWLEPYPDSELDGIADSAPNPEARYTSREAVQLAFIAAIQELPPRQRATLLLCDVLGWAASEAATLLGGSTASINSALQRARETLGKRYRGGGAQAAAVQPSPAQQRLLERYLKAWEGHDLDGLVAILREDASFTMPPWRQWYVGRANIAAFWILAWKICPELRLVPIAANGQPAFAVYELADGRLVARSIHVLTIEDGEIAAITAFVPPTGALLFQPFGLPAILTEAEASRSHRA